MTWNSTRSVAGGGGRAEGSRARAARGGGGWGRLSFDRRVPSPEFRRLNAVGGRGVIVDDVGVVVVVVSIVITVEVGVAAVTATAAVVAAADDGDVAIDDWRRRRSGVEESWIGIFPSLFRFSGQSAVRRRRLFARRKHQSIVGFGSCSIVG